MREYTDGSPVDVAPRRRGGRPRASEPGVRISTWVRVSSFDRIDRAAAKRGTTLSRLLADLIEKHVGR